MSIDKVMRNLFAISVYRTQRVREGGAAGVAREGTAASTKAQKPDVVALSDRVREVQKVRDRLDSVPEVREERVQTLQRQVQSGTYQVPVEDLASRLLNLKQ